MGEEPPMASMLQAWLEAHPGWEAHEKEDDDEEDVSEDNAEEEEQDDSPSSEWTY